MELKSNFCGLLALLAATFTTPAYGAEDSRSRVLHVVTDLVSNTSTNGAVFITSNSFPLLTDVDVSTMTCVNGRSLCSNVTNRWLSASEGRRTSLVTFPDSQQYLLRQQANGLRTTIRSLSDFNSVYSYADTTGVNFSFQTLGILETLNDRTYQFDPISCITAINGFCTRVALSLKDGFARFTLSVPDIVSSEVSLVVPAAFFSNEGSYDLNRFNGIAGRFGASIALAEPNAPAVPEPATWGMMLAGFGMVGVGMRSRRRTVTYA